MLTHNECRKRTPSVWIVPSTNRVTKLVAILIVLTSAPSTLAQAQTGVITGVVQARADGQPIGDAAVRVDGTNLSTTTNAVGRFRLEAVPVGRITLVVHAAGFLDLRVSDVQVQTG